MQIEWILNPLVHCVFLAITLIVCLALFISVKVEIALLRHSFNQCRESDEAAAAALASELAPMRTEMEMGSAEAANLARRAQALQMQSNGTSPEAIADTLRMPRNEIDLMLKLQRLVTTSSKA